jgi:hypothetical protein
MRKLLMLAAGVAVLAAPSLAAAQPGFGELQHREDRIAHAIDRGDATGQISESDANADRQLLADVRDREARLANDHDGLTDGDRADLNSELDGLDARLQRQVGGVY